MMRRRNAGFLEAVWVVAGSQRPRRRAAISQRGIHTVRSNDHL